jgi:hypothetical protein
VRVPKARKRVKMQRKANKIHVAARRLGDGVKPNHGARTANLNGIWEKVTKKVFEAPQS